MSEEKVAFTNAELRRAVQDDSDDWAEIGGTRQILDQGRWVTLHAAVFSHKPSGKHYELSWERPSTEQQDGSESDEIGCVEVELREVTKKKWMPVL
jgi:hypothetical protein